MMPLARPCLGAARGALPDKVEKMAKRNGNRELKKPKQLKDKAIGASSVSDLAARRGPTTAARK